MPLLCSVAKSNANRVEFAGLSSVSLSAVAAPRLSWWQSYRASYGLSSLAEWDGGKQSRRLQFQLSAPGPPDFLTLHLILWDNRLVAMRLIPAVIALFAQHVVPSLGNDTVFLPGVAFALVEDDSMIQQVQSSANFTQFSSSEAALFGRLDTRQSGCPSTHC